jgi:cyclic pyranopterin phosphate synthase
MPEGTKEFIPHPEILRYEEITEIVKVFTEFGIDSVRLTGGEPLVRKGIEKLIAQIRAVERIRDISLTTNGYLLLEKAKSLKEHGLDRVNISIDTLKPEKFAFITGTGDTSALSKVLLGLKEAIEEGLEPVKVNTVLIKGFNDGEIESFIKLSEDYGVEVRFIELMPVGGKFFSRKNFISIASIKEKIEREFGKLIPAKTRKNGPAKSFSVEGTNARIGFIPSISEHFCDSCNRVRLTSDGKLRLCLMRDKEIDLKSVIRNPGYKKHYLRETIAEALRKKAGINGIEALERLGCSRKMFTIGG